MIDSKAKQWEDSENYHYPDDKFQSKKPRSTRTEKYRNDNKQYDQINNHAILQQGTPSVRKKVFKPFESTRMKTYEKNIPLFQQKHNGTTTI